MAAQTLYGNIISNKQNRDKEFVPYKFIDIKKVTSGSFQKYDQKKINQIKDKF